MSENESLLELLARLVENWDAIYVREFVEGLWQNVSLAELPEHVAARHVRRWVETRER